MRSDLKKIIFILILMFLINLGLYFFYVNFLENIFITVIAVSYNILFFSMIIKLISSFNKVIEMGKDFIPHNLLTALEKSNFSVVYFSSVNDSVIWENQAFKSNFGSCVNKNIKEILDGYLVNSINFKDYLLYNDQYFNVIKGDQTFFFQNVTKYVKLENRLQEEKTCIIFIKIDTFNDVSTSMDEVTYQTIIPAIRKEIADYANAYDCVIRRYKSDSYVLFVKFKDFPLMINESTTLLEKIKDISSVIDEMMTLSIGAASGFDLLKNNEFEAAEALDMALARGGNQIVVKEKNKEYRFYGGNSEALEKRNRVKVRMIANSLVKLIKDSSNIVIMPHRNPDLDSIGAALGVVKFCNLYKKEAIICTDTNNFESSTSEVYNLYDLESQLLFKNDRDIENDINEQTLLIIVDTSNTDIIESNKVYNMIKKRVVIDHHRRAKNFVDDALLAFVEPYASSTVELVVELLRFQTQTFSLNPDFATIMLAGMIVDTDYFSTRTGVRTFEAASFLRENNANPTEAKEILQISREVYRLKIKMIDNAVYIDDSIAVAFYDEKIVSRTILAQVAIELLNLKDIKASFMIGFIEDGVIGVSARSNGEFNVQTILEHFNGGGHFTMAATQINSSNMKKIKDELIDLINRNLKGSN